ncbi:hypothetical protein [Qipengyuania qiaonensis]|uniref:Energy transducer TonB n=1 Tax=Qipengyuania qiaonensis TaxID=2867240 RepID=A0ABS7J3N3_9SPHN|nr:hypothetical protein [Qipengyuania qiaonensis]MBX7481896.1 hypothetical protein [Qipengyuania qiaonensis]
MIIRAASGWQTVTADLALILFLITAQAAGQKPEPQSRVDETRQAPATSSALAVHRPAEGETVREWLLATVTDERQLATLSVSYTPGRRTEALVEAERIMAEADDAEVPMRLIAQPNTVDDLVISVDYLRTPQDGTNLAP